MKGLTPTALVARSGCGAVAQLGERDNGIVEVVGSIPIGSTIRSCEPLAPWFSFLLVFSISLIESYLSHRV